MSGEEQEGVVSIWISLEHSECNPNVDVFHDLCGVASYDEDRGETYFEDDQPLVPVEVLIRGLSFGSTFREEAIRAAAAKGITQVYWVASICDYCFEATSETARAAARPHAPVFIGVFAYSTEGFF